MANRNRYRLRYAKQIMEADTEQRRVTCMESGIEHSWHAFDMRDKCVFRQIIANNETKEIKSNTDRN